MATNNEGSLPRLSLCFPTYNRAVLLACALEAVLSQVTPALASDVEVVVLDNASPDETPSVVVRAQDLYPHVPLRSVRHAENIGPDANFVAAVTEARGEFVYLLSDDDVLLPGAVERLLTLIHEYPDFDAFALYVVEFRERPDEVIGKWGLKEDLIIPHQDEALIYLKTHIAFMSCIAFRRANITGREYEDKFATNLGQAYMFVDALAPGRGMYVTRQAYLARRAENNEGYHFFRVFVTNFYQLMLYAQQRGYSSQTTRLAMKRHLNFIFEYVLTFKSQGGYGKLRISYRDCLDGIARLLRAYGPRRFVLVVLVPLLLLPRGIFKLGYNLYLRLHPPAKP